MVLIAAPTGPASTAAVVGSALPPAAASQPALATSSFAQVVTPSVEAADAFASAAVAALTGGSVSSEAGAAGSAVARTSAAWLGRPLSLIGGGVAALALAGGLAAALWPNGDDGANLPAHPVVAEIVPQVVVEHPAPANERIVDAQTADIVDERPSGGELQVAGLSAAAVNPPTLPVLPELPPPSAVANEAPARTIAATAQPQTEAASQRPAPAKEPAAPARPPVLRIDPLDFDPSHLSLSSGTPPPTSATDIGTGPAAVDVANAPAADDRAPAPVADGDPTITVRRGPPSTNTVRRDVAAQLALPIESLELRAVPLSRFIAIVSDMADVPISLDPSALEMTGRSPRQPVAVDAQNTTLGQMLRNVLQQHGMDFVAHDGQLVVIHPVAEQAQARDYGVPDLLPAGVTDAAPVVELIQRFIAPESWLEMGGNGRITAEGGILRIEQPDGLQIAIRVFCERLRVARGLAPTSRYPAERLLTDSPYQRLAAKLDRPTTFTFLPGTRLADIVRLWQDESGVTMLVDWRALAELELAPSSPVSCSALQRSWTDALDAILTGLDLAWWAVDGETIQITSRRAADRLQRVEFHVIPPQFRQQFAGDKALAAALQAEHATAADLFVLNGTHLIVLGNEDAHRALTRRLGGAAD